jgi:3-keto-5-aminohexanoate cleavage enzyme
MTTPVIIEVAVNGLTNRERNPHVPLAANEIAAEARRCLEAGAAIVHSHNAEMAVDATRAAALYLEAWRPVLRERPDALFYPTVGFGPTIVEKYAHVPILAESGLLRIGLVDPGSVNLGGADDEGLPAPVDFVYINSYSDIRHEMGLCERFRLGPSLSIFEPGFLRVALAYQRAGRMPAGALVKLYFGGDEGYLGGGRGGVTFGLPPTRPSLEAYLAMLEGSGLPWSVAVLGGDVIASGLARLALERGGHLRVGLEDYAGPDSPTNVELVKQAVTMAARVGRPVATPSETARLLGLPERGA